MKKIFVLGVGAQKGGTTWLHRQLNNNSNVDMGFRKEYHVFDAIEKTLGRQLEDGTIRNGFREKRINQIIKLHEKNRLGINQGPKRVQTKYAALHLSFIDNTDTYFDYFDYLYLKNPKVEIVGDITPNYALLSPSSFRLIRKGLIKRGFDVKVFFLMRDPVEREWSLARMKHRNMAAKRKDNFDEFEHMLNSISSKSCYQNTIDNIEKVFKKSEIYYGFYENLFTPESSARIINFIGSNLNNFDSGEVVNASPKSTPIPEEINSQIAQKFAETYNFIEERFGHSVEEIWQGYKVLKSNQ